MFIVVVDSSGIVKASHRMDGNGQASPTLAPLKAQTANGFRTATHQLAAAVAGDPARLASIASAPGFTLLGGGVPLRVGGTVIGAIGVGGGSAAQDVDVAEAGAAALQGTGEGRRGRAPRRHAGHAYARVQAGAPPGSVARKSGSSSSAFSGPPGL
jgi:uncharacterized protein GlcG (DUF336 family)